jgi:RNA polymerase sigma factor (sigma-70 family)
VGRPLDDTALVARARRGDDSAFGALVRAHQGIAFRIAYVITGASQDAEEVVQDAFVKAHRALGRFRPGSPFRPWLLQIVGNEARNRRRASSRRDQAHLRAEVERLPAGESAEGEALGAERRSRLIQAVAALPEVERLVIVCRYFLDLSELETAAALAVPPGTVKSRLVRALARLRDLLAEEAA